MHFMRAVLRREREGAEHAPHVELTVVDPLPSRAPRYRSIRELLVRGHVRHFWQITRKLRSKK